jgi:hypothetical protein
LQNTSWKFCIKHFLRLHAAWDKHNKYIDNCKYICMLFLSQNAQNKNEKKNYLQPVDCFILRIAAMIWTIQESFASITASSLLSALCRSAISCVFHSKIIQHPKNTSKEYIIQYTYRTVYACRIGSIVVIIYKLLVWYCKKKK